MRCGVYCSVFSKSGRKRRIEFNVENQDKRVFAGMMTIMQRRIL